MLGRSSYAFNVSGAVRSLCVWVCVVYTFSNPTRSHVAFPRQQGQATRAAGGRRRGHRRAPRAAPGRGGMGCWRYVASRIPVHTHQPSRPAGRWPQSHPHVGSPARVARRGDAATRPGHAYRLQSGRAVAWPPPPRRCVRQVCDHSCAHGERRHSPTEYTWAAARRVTTPCDDTQATLRSAPITWPLRRRARRASPPAAACLPAPPRGPRGAPRVAVVERARGVVWNRGGGRGACE